MASNYMDVLAQLQAAGLLVNTLEIGTKNPARCKVEGEREKRGWYHLHELRLPNGDDLIVGSYGIWRGNESNTTKVDIRRAKLEPEQLEILKKRLAEDRKRADAMRQAEAERAAKRAAAAWKGFGTTGESDYLTSKGVQAHGLRFSGAGALVIPMTDTAGKVHGLQVIRSKAQVGQNRRLPKEFWPAGLVKKGHFHLIGGTPAGVLLVAEGYATAASLYEATGLPVAVAFDAGNLAPVAEALHARYRKARILLCADDDTTQKCQQPDCRKPVWLDDGPHCPHCGKPHGAQNAGVSAASGAALAVGGAWVVPQFEDKPARRAAWLERGQNLNDFNDLHAASGLHTVRVQIEAKLDELRWRDLPSKAQADAADGGFQPLRKLEDPDAMLERFALVYGQDGTVFDRQERMLLKLADVQHACAGRNLFRTWYENPDCEVVRLENVGFDPTGKDQQVTCNLWGGWPTQPQAGKCQMLLDLLRYLCQTEATFDWVIKWLAYPLQHPGAKMQTTLVFHGPQGIGKNLFFDAYMKIYGRYAGVVDQTSIESQFNDWASGKLFLQFDEVVARVEVYHVKNRLKSFITGHRIRINPKNRTPYEETNHFNGVFMSNEAQPVALDSDDRRHMVVKTPMEKLSLEFYDEVHAEICNGGIAALHHHLLHLDLGNFTTHTNPLMTEAKCALIDIGMETPHRFIEAFKRGELDGFPAANAPKVLAPMWSMDLFELYQEWCRRMGLRGTSQPQFQSKLEHLGLVKMHRKRYTTETGVRKQGPVLFMPEGHTPPEGASESDWLSERIAIFKTALKDYKATALGGVHG